MAESSTRSSFADTLKRGDFAFTAEITPPASGAREDLMAVAEPYRGKTDALNVTDGPRGLVHMSSLAAAAILRSEGFDPILQMTCRDRNRIALQADMLGAAALGIGNILALRGDDPPADDDPPAKAVFDMDGREVIAVAHRMAEESVTGTGRKITSPPKFFLGAADTPIDPPTDWSPDGLIAKADAGAQFVQTQFCFDMEILRRYIGRLEDLGLTDRLDILIGLGPLVTARSARWMRDNLWGVLVPDSIIYRMEQSVSPAQEGIDVCVELIDGLREIRGVAGVHLMAPAKPERIHQVLSSVRR
jgi:methylenetetrahydrofolate reductase (NADPH)